MSFSNSRCSTPSSPFPTPLSGTFPLPYNYTLPNRLPRRRKRPSHRTRIERKTLSRYDDYSDSIAIAHDEDIKLALMGNGNRSHPSPLLRRNFDQSWLRWKEKEAACEKEEREALALRECEERRIFGGDIGDDGSLCPKMLDVVRFLFGGDDFGYPGS